MRNNFFIYDIDDEIWEEAARQLAASNQPVRCKCGLKASTKCRFCGIDLCEESYCRAMHEDQYHSQLWMNRKTH